MNLIKITYKKLFHILNILICIIIISKPCMGDVAIFNINTIDLNINTDINNIKIINYNKNIEPEKIELYIKNERYAGAVIYYSKKEINFSDLEKALDMNYPDVKYKKNISDKFVVWRIDGKNIAISLSEDESCRDENAENFIIITYRKYD